MPIGDPPTDYLPSVECFDCCATTEQTSATKKRFQKNPTSSSSWSNRMVRRSIILKTASTIVETADTQQPHENLVPVLDCSDNECPKLTKAHAKSSFNLCDDEKLHSLAARQASDTNGAAATTISAIERSAPPFDHSAGSSYCTMPRRPRAKSSSLCTFHTIVFEKGPGKKSLGFTIVGGRDSPRGALGIFIKSILATGQATDDGRLRAGDEILSVNGAVCHDVCHSDAVKLFKSVKTGAIVLNVCRRTKASAPAATVAELDRRTANGDEE